MPRIDLPELEDQAWCPNWVRDSMTGYLRTVSEVARPYSAAAKPLSELLDVTGSNRVLDLASGAGGPWIWLSTALRRTHPTLAVRLSDLMPNHQWRGPGGARGIEYVEEPVSALSVPPEYEGQTRTIFTGLHHFDRDEVRAILRSAQASGVGFAAFEATQRSPRGLILTLMIPLLVLILMPRVKPRRLLPLVLTYLLPLLPIAIWWDGFASTLRTYTVEELRSIVAEIEEQDYRWIVEEVPVPHGPIPMLKVVGHPVPDVKESGRP